MKIACIGIGNVGAALASSLIAAKYDVVVAARDVNSVSVKAARKKIPQLNVELIKPAVTAADVVFLATPFDANDTALKSAGPLKGKVLVDCTNPVGSGITHSLGGTRSGGEYVQNLAPHAHVVKAFTVYGFENIEDSTYPGYGKLKPAMFLCGEDQESKDKVAGICKKLGWEPLDCGGIAMSLHLEHMALLWIKLGRVQGHGADFVWARLTR